MKSAKQRLNNIIGQVEGVKKMLDVGSDCVQLLTQLKAIKSAVSGVMDTVVEEQFDTCMSSLNEADKKLLIKMKNYVKSN
jgi:DNA-binding FrmR family transcriptional regulator